MNEFETKTLISNIKKDIDYLKIERVTQPKSTLQVYDMFIGYNNQEIDFQYYKERKEAWDLVKIASIVEEHISRYEYLNGIINKKTDKVS